jgi:thymidylate synthase
MIGFRNADEQWMNMVHLLLKQEVRGSRNGPVREIIGWSSRLEDARQCWVTNTKRAGARGYACAELVWYLRGDQNIEMLGKYAPSYERFTNDGLAMGAYGDRWRNNPGIRQKSSRSALQLVVELLREKPDDRRAVVSMWDSGDLVEAVRGVWRDIPCTIAMQFLVRDGKLHGVTTMRSNDVWLGTVYDVFAFCQIQCLLAAALGLEVGSYTHNVGSMHLYEKDREKAEAALEGGCVTDFMAMPEIDADEALEVLGMRSLGRTVPLFTQEINLREGRRIATDGLLGWTAEVLAEMMSQRMKVLSKEGAK